MQDADLPRPGRDGSPTESPPPAVDSGDGELEANEHDLEQVEAALDALDADDLDAAEAVVDRLAAVDEAAATDPDPA